MSTESVTKSKRGGKREGAGRKPLSGYGTVVMRVPFGLKKYILSMIDIYVDWLNNDEMKKYMKERTTAGERLQAINIMERLVQHERERIEERARNDNDERQMSLFEEQHSIE